MAMEKVDRDEMRAIFHETLAGYEQANKMAYNSMNASLKRIDAHLLTLNGSVAAHEKTINTHLPHTIAHCPQMQTIDDLKKEQITSKMIVSAILKGAGIISGTITFLFLVYEFWIKNLT